LALGTGLFATGCTGVVGGGGDSAGGADAAGGSPSPVTAAPFGSWASPIAAGDLAKAAVGTSDVRVFDGRVFWRESRPDEGGRQVLRTLGADGQPTTLTPEGFSVRTRVQEYGGSSYWVMGERIVFANFADQRLYVQQGEAAPVAITPEKYQYSDCVVDAARGALVCVREDHTEATKKANGEERNEIVRVVVPDADALAAHDAASTAAATCCSTMPPISSTRVEMPLSSASN
jgi:hypothetical protein